MENANIKGPVGDLETFYGEKVTSLAKRGKSFLEELTRIQSFKKAKSAMRSFGRLNGGTGVGIFARERELYDASLKQYKKSWTDTDDEWPVD